jgi:hypothetical protein
VPTSKSTAAPPTIKTYPRRGPLQQFRLAEAVSFRCFRCGGDKKTKLHAVYEDDWSRRLCNGCYGLLLSIYEVKAGTATDDQRAAQLAMLLLQLTSPVEAERAFVGAVRGVASRASAALSAPARRFIGSSERLATELKGETSLDWSGMVIGLCKAFEAELVLRVVEPLKSNSCRVGEPDLQDDDLARIANYCGGRMPNPPELGAVGRFLRAARVREGSDGSDLLSSFYELQGSWDTAASWLTDDPGAASALTTLTRQYRNPAAHLEELSEADYRACREFVIGPRGIIWTLVEATSANSTKRPS